MAEVKAQADRVSVNANEGLKATGQVAGGHSLVEASNAISHRERHDRVMASVTRVMHKHRATFAALAK